ncbi:MAG: efflux RND transporter permease subunit [Candidatus Latescibacteria bacterium]|nr:efflux RND transporter permease subunit [Candidatus Latescibacterota bacterium]
MKKLPQFSVNYPITIVMLILAVILLGYISFQKLGMDLFPDIKNPRIFVELKAGELPPEEIEQKYVKNIESLAIRQKNAIQVSSVSRVGSAQVTVEYSWQTKMDEAFLDLQKALSNFNQDDDIDEFSITQHDPNADPIILFAFSHPDITDMDGLRKTAESYLRNELIRLEGIADVRLLGQEEKEVLVETEPYLLEAFNVTPSVLASRINDHNRNISGGSIEEMGRRYVIKGVGEFGSLDDIAHIIVAYRQANETGTENQSGEFSDRIPIFLKDVANIRFRNKEPENIVRMGQKRCMGVAVYKEMKYNTVRAVEEFTNTLEKIRKALPGYELTVIQNKGEFITSTINEVKQTALIGILLAVIVLFVFLRRIGTTAVISAAIPISIIATFNLMYFNGLTFNIMTLGGLALGAGMLVDNAIIVMENIFRNLESGLTVKEAAVLGASQVSGSITAATLTTIVVFLPIVYLHGSAGALFKEQAWTVAFSLLSSLFVALLVIPMLASRLLRKPPPNTKQKDSIRFPMYSAFLRYVLRVRWLVIGIAAALVAGAIYLIPVLGSEFIPKTELNEFSIYLKLPEGTELNRTADTAESISESIGSILGDDVKTIFSVAGPSQETGLSSGSFFEDENTATITIVLKENRSTSTDEIFKLISGVIGEIPDLEAQFIREQTALELTLGTEQAPIVIEIQGEDMDILQKLTGQVHEQALTLEDLYNVETSFEEGRPEIDIVLDRVRAGLYNIGINAISSQLKTQLTGTSAGEWETEGELKDITIELPKIATNQLENITIPSGDRVIRLYEIADIRTTQAPKEITRKNQVRIGKVTAHLKTNKPLDHVVQSIMSMMSEISFPSEYRYSIAGEEQKRQEAFGNLKFALILSLILVYMVLASQFESLIHPFTIILSIPLGVVGAIAIFFILGRSLNIMAYIGIIMLVGIAVNDSIILIDAINQLKKEGLSRTEAIIEAGQRRIRPIIMTSLTTILALLPLTLGFGEGAALRSPMALAVIGGLITSTLLTLVVIPCVYSVLDRLTLKG